MRRDIGTIHLKGERPLRILVLLLAVLIVQGCTTLVGATVGTATTVAVEVAKAPFRVAGAAIDVATDDEDD